MFFAFIQWDTDICGGRKHSSPEEMLTIKKFHHYLKISSMAAGVFFGLFECFLSTAYIIKCLSRNYSISYRDTMNTH